MKNITLKSGKEIELNQAFNVDCLESCSNYQIVV